MKQIFKLRIVLTYIRCKKDLFFDVDETIFIEKNISNKKIVALIEEIDRMATKYHGITIKIQKPMEDFFSTCAEYHRKKFGETFSKFTSGNPEENDGLIQSIVLQEIEKYLKV